MQNNHDLVRQHPHQTGWLPIWSWGVIWQHNGMTVSNSRFRKRVQTGNVNVGVIRKNPNLFSRQNALQLDFTWEHGYWTWVKCLFVTVTSESRFKLFQNDGRIYVHWRVEETLLPKCMIFRALFGVSRILMWGNISTRDAGMIP